MNERLLKKKQEVGRGRKRRDEEKTIRGRRSFG